MKRSILAAVMVASSTVRVSAGQTDHASQPLQPPPEVQAAYWQAEAAAWRKVAQDEQEAIVHQNMLIKQLQDHLAIQSTKPGATIAGPEADRTVGQK